MPTGKRRRNSEAVRSDDGNVPTPRDENWDERLRLVGNANFVDVEWSGRDHPSWPLPQK